MKEYADFLRSQAPYDQLGPADLDRLARRVEVEYVPAGTIVFREGAEPLDRMYVIRTGSAEVLDRGRVVDLLGPGDTFGHVSLFSGLPPALAVRTAEDTLCYLLPDPRGLLSHPDVLRFAHYGTLIARERLTGGVPATDHGSELVSAHARPVVWCDDAEPLAEVASRISDARQSCALVRSAAGLGIVTDSDFRRLVAAGRFQPRDPVRQVATFPARTVTEQSTVAEAFLAMIEHDVHHLPVIDRSGRPVAVVRVVDLASVEVRDPLMIRSAVQHAADAPALALAARSLPATAVSLADAGVPPLRIAALVATVRDAIMRRLIGWAAGAGAAEGGGDGRDDAGCSWMVLGSTGRGEPFPDSDLDTAIAWADGADPARPLQLAGAVLADMERCGLVRCPDGANATERAFSRPASEWREAVARWVGRPTGQGTALLISTIADARPLTAPELGGTLTRALVAAPKSFDFIEGLLNLALYRRPPTGFVRDFVVEHSGEHRGELNLKRGGLSPVADIARWTAIVSGDLSGTTIDRLSRARQAGLLTPDEADSLIGAYTQIFRIQFRRDLDAIRAGEAPSRYLAPGSLDSLTRRLLREIFRMISQVQAALEGGWVSRVR